MVTVPPSAPCNMSTFRGEMTPLGSPPLPAVADGHLRWAWLRWRDFRLPRPRVLSAVASSTGSAEELREECIGSEGRLLVLLLWRATEAFTGAARVLEDSVTSVVALWGREVAGAETVGWVAEDVLTSGRASPSGDAFALDSWLPRLLGSVSGFDDARRDSLGSEGREGWDELLLTMVLVFFDGESLKWELRNEQSLLIDTDLGYWSSHGKI